MTNREFFNAVVSNNITEEVIAHAENSLAKLDERNARRRDKPSKTAIANKPIKEKIVQVLTDTPQSASQIAEKVEISVQKCSALLKQIEGLTITEIKVKGKGKVKGYALA